MDRRGATGRFMDRRGAAGCCAARKQICFHWELYVMLIFDDALFFPGGL